VRISKKLFVLIVLLILLEIRTKPEFFLENDKNQLLSFKFLTKSTKWLFILYSNYNCIDCVLKLDHFVNSLKDNNIKKGVIIRCDNNIMIKKELLNKIKKLLPGYYVFLTFTKVKTPGHLVISKMEFLVTSKFVKHHLFYLQTTKE
jgi:hypothetical protein